MQFYVHRFDLHRVWPYYFYELENKAIINFLGRRFAIYKKIE